MNVVCLDFETYFDDDYSLKKMTTEAYVRDQRFEVLGCAIRGKVGSWTGPTFWCSAPNFVGTVKYSVDWPNTVVVCHHAQFDGLILEHHYGIRPAAWICTLSMARLVIGNHVCLGLDSLALHFGLRAKSVPYQLFKGRRWHELDDAARRQIADGACHDVDLTWEILGKLAKNFPAEEYELVDMTVRMFTEPQLLGNLDVLAKIWAREESSKRTLREAIGCTDAELQSAETFARLLRDAGIEPEMKQGRNGLIYAFAKTDQFMRDLEEHPDEYIRALVCARLGVKSTLEQTRAERFGWMATRGALPVYLNYCGAHTTRWSGGDRVNWQNLGRQSELRTAPYCRDGQRIIKADKSQIECRILNRLAGQWDVIERFANGEDPYIGIASKFYGFEVTKEHKRERGTGKQLELSCGYGAGAQTIVDTAKRGTYGPVVELTITQGYEARDLYRATHPAVVELWSKSDWLLGRMARGQRTDFLDVLRIDGTTIYLPNDAPLHYDGLHWCVDGRLPDGTLLEPHWRFRTRSGWKKIWGGFLVENYIQALSRVDIGQCLLRLKRNHGLRPVNLEHDAAAFVVPVDRADELLSTVLQEFKRPPTWLPDIPLDAEGQIGVTYAGEKG